MFKRIKNSLIQKATMFILPYIPRCLSGFNCFTPICDTHRILELSLAALSMSSPSSWGMAKLPTSGHAIKGQGNRILLAIKQKNSLAQSGRQNEPHYLAFAPPPCAKRSHAGMYVYNCGSTCANQRFVAG